jgi:catechol 2,3-dioxygenase-like lactoylglutathione lyase family enzyme
VPGAALFLGIDHTAIATGDTAKGIAFYRGIGLRVAGGSENYGPEQERLNAVPGAHLRITTMRADEGPGVELLEYLAPKTGRPMPADERSDDLVHWRTTMSADGVSGSCAVRDPDGHVMEVHEKRP